MPEIENTARNERGKQEKKKQAATGNKARHKIKKAREWNERKKQETTDDLRATLDFLTSSRDTLLHVSTALHIWA